MVDEVRVSNEVRVSKFDELILVLRRISMQIEAQNCMSHRYALMCATDPYINYQERAIWVLRASQLLNEENHEYLLNTLINSCDRAKTKALKEAWDWYFEVAENIKAKKKK